MIPNIIKTADLTQEISAAAREEDIGAQQINKAVIELDSLVQRSASSAEEFASLSEEMAAQSDELLKALQFFRFDKKALAAAQKKTAVKPALKAPALKPGLPPSPSSVQPAKPAPSGSSTRFGSAAKPAESPRSVQPVGSAGEPHDAAAPRPRNVIARNDAGVSSSFGGTTAQKDAPHRNVIKPEFVKPEPSVSAAAADNPPDGAGAGFEAMSSAQDYVPTSYVSDSDFEEF